VLPGDYSYISDTFTYYRPGAYETEYIESFSLNNRKFRLIRDTANSGDYVLQVYSDDQWLANLKLPAPQFCYSAQLDLNRDGLYEFIESERGMAKFHLFDKATGEFNHVPIVFSEDFALLDPERLIYGSNKREEDSWNIEIFSISGNKKIYLYKIKMALILSPVYTIVNSMVYRCTNGNIADTVFVREDIIHKRNSDFSMNQYMKELVNK
jgi:hypothetical protein